MKNKFLPKARDDALTVIKHQLYSRLDWCETLIADEPSEQLNGWKEWREGYDDAVKLEINFLRDVIDMIERS